MEKKNDLKSEFLVAGGVAIFFAISGIIGWITNKHDYRFTLVTFVFGGLLLVYLLYVLKKKKENKNEICMDERTEFIKEKSSSMSFNILLGLILILKFIIEGNYVVVDSSFLIDLIFWITLLIKFGTHLICKYKY